MTGISLRLYSWGLTSAMTDAMDWASPGWNIVGYFCSSSRRGVFFIIRMVDPRTPSTREAWIMRALVRSSRRSRAPASTTSPIASRSSKEGSIAMVRLWTSGLAHRLARRVAPLANFFALEPSVRADTSLRKSSSLWTSRRGK